MVSRRFACLFLAVSMTLSSIWIVSADQSHQIQDAAEAAASYSAADKCYAVEGEKAHAAPVQCADDDQNQRDAVNDLQRVSLRFLTGYMA